MRPLELEASSHPFTACRAEQHTQAEPPVREEEEAPRGYTRTVCAPHTRSDLVTHAWAALQAHARDTLEQVFIGRVLEEGWSVCRRALYSLTMLS